VVLETLGEDRAVVLGVMLTKPRPCQKPTKPNRHQKSHKPSSNNHHPGVEAEVALGADRSEGGLGEVPAVVLGEAVSLLAPGAVLLAVDLGVDR